jgi:mercuric ion binding protein
MRKILIALIMVSTVAVFAKPITKKIKVEGECDMCKDKIEAALDIPGVSFAEWDVESKMLTVRFNDKKINEDEIHTLMSELGYATDKLAANVASQKKLDSCCQPKVKSKGCCSSKSSCEKKK